MSRLSRLFNFPIQASETCWNRTIFRAAAMSGRGPASFCFRLSDVVPVPCWWLRPLRQAWRSLMMWRMKAGGSVGCCEDTYQNLRWFGQENMESTIISLIIVKIIVSTIKNGLRILPVSNQYCEKLRIYQGEQGELTCQKLWVFTSQKGNSSIKA